MTLAPGPSTVSSADGGSPIEFEGGFSRTPGAVGDAITFGYAEGAALGTADSSEAFNPEGSPFAVAASFRTDTVPVAQNYSPNIVQKGLFGSDGQWKMQLKGTAKGTVAGCRFQGTERPEGVVVEDETKTPLDDGEWHEVVCWRSSDAYGVTVDGADTSQTGQLGVIATSLPLRVANKALLAGVQDQLQGSIDCVAYVDGAGSPRETAESEVPC